MGAVEVLDLVDSEMITESWLKEAEKTYSPNTVVSYLLSLGHFKDFPLTKSCVRYFEFTNGEHVGMQHFRKQLPRWRKSYAKDRQRRHWSNMAEFIVDPLIAGGCREVRTVQILQRGCCSSEQFYEIQKLARH